MALRKARKQRQHVSIRYANEISGLSLAATALSFPKESPPQRLASFLLESDQLSRRNSDATWKRNASLEFPPPFSRFLFGYLFLLIYIYTPFLFLFFPQACGSLPLRSIARGHPTTRPPRLIYARFGQNGRRSLIYSTTRGYTRTRKFRREPRFKEGEQHKNHGSWSHGLVSQSAHAYTIVA